MRKLLPPWCALAVLLVVGCHRTDNPVVSTDSAGPDPAPDVRQLRDGIRQYSDVVVKEAAAANELAKDATVTEVIKQYEALKPDERARYVIDNRDKMQSVYGLVGKDDDPQYQQAMARLDALLAKMFGGRLYAQMPPADFNLAMAKTEVYAKQVNLTNEFFGDMHPEAHTALESFNKMTPDQKKVFLVAPDASSNIVYWQYVYYARKAALLWYLRNYAIQTEWGYKTPVSATTRAALEEVQFDLKRHR